MDERQKEIGRQIVDRLTGEKREDPQLDDWLNEDTLHQADYDRYRKIWDASASYIPADAFDTEQAWNRIDRTIGKRERFRHRLSRIGYVLAGMAASLLLLFSLSRMGWLNQPEETVMQIEAGIGSRSETTLPDGTRVRLNAGSKLRYAYNARKRLRQVHFEGEGFFDVAKREAPFVVEMADDLQLRVRGTSFNLRAYPDESRVEAALLEGHIELGHGGKRYSMSKGEMAEFDRYTREIRPLEGKPSDSCGWLEDKLIMRGMPFADVCKYIERRYAVKVSYPEKLARELSYDGVLSGDSLTDLLNILSRLSRIEYNVKGNQVYITSRHHNP